MNTGALFESADICSRKASNKRVAFGLLAEKAFNRLRTGEQVSSPAGRRVLNFQFVLWQFRLWQNPVC